MNEIQMFNNEEFGKLDVINVDGEPWFIGRQVAEILGAKDPSKNLQQDLKEKHRAVLSFHGEIKNPLIKGFSKTVDITGLAVPRRGLVIINEAGLYELVLHSRIPAAERFQDWVVEDVLPSIRKHGMYMTTNTIERLLADPDTVITILRKYKEEKERANNYAEVIEREKEFTQLGHSVMASKDTISVNTMAKQLCQKGVDIGEKRLFEDMRRNNYLLHSEKEYNKPSQRMIETGYMEFTEHTWTNPYTHIVHTSFTPKITAKGQQFFFKKYGVAA